MGGGWAPRRCVALAMKVTTDKVRGVLDRFLEFMVAECESLTPAEQDAAHAVIADVCTMEVPEMWFC